ncbi:MAG: Gfo/Idh/MocA family oxidoreductase [Clostridia bacterium]|nr:Gfo/Idh/MocA family oxidoreductase [Clostridia bacterium]
MEKVKIGVLGVQRGNSMISFSRDYDKCELVAICDYWEEGLMKKKEELNDDRITYYLDYEEFLKHDMDAVILANYANEHAPFAVKALKAGKAVFSECLPFQTMKQAVELIETVEETGGFYMYGENYCYMPAPREMRRDYQKGLIGEFEYGEGEYLHNCESIWHGITQGKPDHWRNNMYANFYCTHSMGPLVHITGMRPVSVIGLETPYNERTARMGTKEGGIGVEMVTFENGGVAKSLHGVGCSRDSVYYNIWGSLGQEESNRECQGVTAAIQIFKSLDEFEGENKGNKYINDYPIDEYAEAAKSYGHGGSDFYCMKEFVDYILGNKDADIIDVYEACDMFLPGMFGYRSVLAGNIPMEIPNLRDKAVRDQWRNDTWCTDPKVAGDMLVPSYSKGNPDVPQEVYDKVREKWLNK